MFIVTRNLFSFLYSGSRLFMICIFVECRTACFFFIMALPNFLLCSSLPMPSVDATLINNENVGGRCDRVDASK